MNYIFFGTPHFAVIILEALIKADYLPALVVTAPDKPKGRGHILTPPSVKIRAEKHDIPVLQPVTLKSNEIINAIVALRPDFFIVAAYGKIIPKTLLDIPQSGGLNIHPSLLPRYRGPSPIQAAILNGDKTTGVTIMLMDEEMDHGPILAQQELTLNIQCSTPTLNVERCHTAKELSEKLGELGAQLLIETIPKWLNNEITPQSQDHTKATYTKIITKEDGRVEWRASAEKIERMTRAYTPWPSAWTILKLANTKCLPEKDARVKILRAFEIQAVADYLNATPGQIVNKNSDLLVACGNGFLVVKELQSEGKKPMSGKEFLNAYPFARLFSSAPPKDHSQLSR